MALKVGATVSTAETDYGTVILGERAGDYWELNPTGTLVVNTLMAGGDEAAGVAALSDEFDIDLVQAKQDVDALVQQAGLGGWPNDDPSALERPTGAPFARRLAARGVLPPALALSLLPPRRIRAMLDLACRGATPATAAQAKNARDAMCAVSLRCAGPKARFSEGAGAGAVTVTVTVGSGAAVAGVAVGSGARSAARRIPEARRRRRRERRLGLRFHPVDE